MNFNYGMNYDLSGKTIRKKGDESNNGPKPESKEEEKPKSSVVAPKAAAVEANSAELVMNYIKGAMLPKGPSNVADPESAQVSDPQTAPRSGSDVNWLIDKWNALPEDATNQVKLDLLTDIIDAFGDDEDGARIWRVRRYTISFNMNIQENFEFAQYIQNFNNVYYVLQHEIPTASIDPRDEQAFQELQLNYNNYTYGVSCDPEEISVSLESVVAMMTDQALYSIIWSLSGFNQDPETTKGDLNASVPFLESKINEWVERPENDNEPWRDTYLEFTRQLERFESIVNNSNVGGMVTPDEMLQHDADIICDLVESLREQGFPYCDNLLVIIQGYLICGDHGNIHVL